MSIRLGIVMDPIAQINFKKDSSLAMLLAAQARGWSLFYMEQRDLYQSAGQARARMAALTVFNDPQRWFELEEEKDAPLADLDVILMRKDPPFDNEFVYSTYLLEQAERDGVLVVNRPQSLRDCNEKLFATQFPHCMPPTLVSRRVDILREFAETQRDIILKPLDGMGGSSIFRHRAGDPNLSVILETLTAHGTQQIMAQEYLPQIVAELTTAGLAAATPAAAVCATPPEESPHAALPLTCCVAGVSRPDSSPCPRPDRCPAGRGADLPSPVSAGGAAVSRLSGGRFAGGGQGGGVGG